MHASLLALLALPLASPALAQTAAPVDTAHFYRHHLGLTASPQLDYFFTANRSLPVGLLYKYQNRAHALWRFGLTLNQDYSRQDEYKPDFSPTNLKNNPEYINNSFGVSLSLGREYTHQFTRRWTGTAGADLNVCFSQNKYVRTYQRLGVLAQNIPSTEVQEGYRLRYYQAALTPFAGLRFLLWSRFYTSIESAIQLNYLRQTDNAIISVTDISTGQLLAGSNDFSEQQITTQSLNLRYCFINQVSVHYQLGKQ